MQKKLGSKSKIKLIKNLESKKKNTICKWKIKNFLKLLKSRPTKFSDECFKILTTLIKYKSNIIKNKSSLD